MKKIYYSVAMSLDGFIAGPDGEYDWITIDPDIDFEAYYSRFDTLVMGRKTFEIAGSGATPGTKTVVVSRTLKQEDHPNTRIINDNLEDAITELRSEHGKDIWLFGGGVLFTSLLELGFVDVVEVAIIPVLLGTGVSLVQSLKECVNLTFIGTRVYEKTGTVLLEYSVDKTDR